ncbi:hypothetical protein TUSST3_50720 [Streptomyces sp. TUS-ST3]|nr:hypothetical protein TUSST3_50720 [Streptomyces sp. TUS-ST3]
MAVPAVGREGAERVSQCARAHASERRSGDPLRGAELPRRTAPPRGRVRPPCGRTPRTAYPAELTGRDQLGVVPVSRHNARYSGIGGV